MSDVPDELVARGLDALCSAMVSSTTPNPAPMWPPVTEQVSMRKSRTSCASWVSSAEESVRRSAGLVMRSRRVM
jgi:hypothetical protein